MVTQEQFPTGLEQQSSEPVMPPAAPASLVPKIDLDDHQWYLNRELTWLAFKRRVLHEAEDERVPLLERLKFIAIVSGNMDEFFMKRIGGLKQQIGAGMRELTPDGRTPVSRCRNVMPLYGSWRHIKTSCCSGFSNS